MPDRRLYRPVNKALHRPLTIWGVDRRLFFLALMLGGGDVQLVLLVPRRPSDVRGPVRVCALGHASGSGDAAHSTRIIDGPPTLRPRQARPGRHGADDVVRIGRILRDYAEAGSLDGLLSLWGFVDDTTFLTKAGHVGGRAIQSAAWTTKGCRTPSGRCWCIGWKRACGCSTNTAASTSTSLKRTIEPIVSAPCAQPIAHEAIQRRAAYLNTQPARALQPVALRGAALRGAPRRSSQQATSGTPLRSPRQALRAWLSTDRRRPRAGVGAGSRGRGAATTRRRRSRCRSATSA